MIFNACMYQGADLNWREEDASIDPLGRSAFLWSALKGCDRTIAFLIECRADLNTGTTQDDVNALLYAAGKGFTGICQLLIGKKANVEHKTKQGVTALIRASAKNKKQTVEYLIKAGARVNASTNSGLTSLHFASGTYIIYIYPSWMHRIRCCGYTPAHTPARPYMRMRIVQIYFCAIQCLLHPRAFMRIFVFGSFSSRCACVRRVRPYERRQTADRFEEYSKRHKRRPRHSPYASCLRGRAWYGEVITGRAG